MVCFEVIVRSHFVSVKTTLPSFAWFDNCDDFAVEAGFEDVFFCIVGAVAYDFIRQATGVLEKIRYVSCIVRGTGSETTCKRFACYRVDENTQFDWTSYSCLTDDVRIMSARITQCKVCAVNCSDVCLASYCAELVEQAPHACREPARGFLYRGPMRYGKTKFK